MAQALLRNSTAKVAEALQAAMLEVANIKKAVLPVEFVLVALIEQRDSIVLKIFDELRLDTAKLRRDINDRALNVVKDLPDIGPSMTGYLNISQDVQHLFESADREKNKLGDIYISTGTMFLACFDPSVPSIKAMLEDLGLHYEPCFKALNNLRGAKKITQRDAESKTLLLDKYTTDITALARRGLLDPVIGREKEITRTIEILSRRKKNNPVLIGEPGVGKTVIVEGLAQQIVAADVPEYLINKRVLSLEMGTLIAGAKVQGEFEERIKTIRDEIIAASGDIILFIDELHTVVGAGRTGGGLDASNMLKPALAKGQLQCIGATTTKEYKQYIESDKALERRFQTVMIDQPSVEDTIKILLGLKQKYGEHHSVEYSDESLKVAAELSDRYITERFLPDKAIDLIDEAGAAKRLKIIYTPPELRSLETKRQELEANKTEAFNEHDFEKMAKYQMELARLDAQFQDKKKEFFSKCTEKDRIINAENIAEVVHRKTGIPVSKMISEEAERLKNLEASLESRVIGQSHAVHSVANAIRRNRAGLRNRKAPIASFLFLGPTGVGKTELAKALAFELMNDESKIIRVDMSEYMERHEVSKLIGAPPGYVGYGEGGQLTERVRRNPYSVVLFDEFEKAHFDVYNILLQVLDEGFLTDGEGQKVSFQNCIVIGTSNLGSDILSDRKRPIGLGLQNDWDTKEEQDAIMTEVKKHLRPEFINRLDEIVIFNRLGKKELEKILDLQINDLNLRLAKMGYDLDFRAEAKAFILSSIETLNYGARPLRRKLEQAVENEIASLVIAQPGDKKGKITISMKNNLLSFDLD